MVESDPLCTLHDEEEVDPFLHPWIRGAGELHLRDNAAPSDFPDPLGTLLVWEEVGRVEDVKVAVSVPASSLVVGAC